MFEAELRHWDRKLHPQKWKTLFLADNCPAYPVPGNLESIKLVLLPSNTTSMLQPMDQGVVRRLMPLTQAATRGNKIIL
jgi:hypothetical protein